MKNKISRLDVVLIFLWSVLLVNASSIKTEGLMFDLPIQAHLTITGVLIAAKIFYKRFFIRVNG